MNVAVVALDFVDTVISQARDTIAGQVAILQLLNQGWQVRFKLAIAFFELAGLPFEGIGNENLSGWRIVITVVP